MIETWEIVVAVIGIFWILGLIHVFKQAFTKPKRSRITRAKRINIYTEEQKEQLRKYNEDLYNQTEYVADAWGLRKNLYRWQCTICKKVYYERQAAILCCRKEKDKIEESTYKEPKNRVKGQRKSC